MSEARRVAEDFMTAWIKEKKIDAIMKTVTVPFAIGAKETIKDPIQLKDRLALLLTEEPRRADFKVCLASAFGSLPDRVLSENDQKVFSDVLEKTDSVVLVRLPRQVIAFGVRFQDDQAKVVGMRFPITPLALLSMAEAIEKQDKRAAKDRDIAKDAVAEFLKTAKAKNLNGLLNLTGIPFYEDGTEIIRNEAKLKALLKSAWIDFAGNPRFPTYILGVIRFESFGEPYFGERLQVGNILGTDGWVVFIGQKGKQNGMILVRVKNGTAKIVGATG
jgi:hypothetical protein